MNVGFLETGHVCLLPRLPLPKGLFESLHTSCYDQDHGVLWDSGFRPEESHLKRNSFTVLRGVRRLKERVGVVRMDLSLSVIPFSFVRTTFSWNLIDTLLSDVVVMLFLS